jgi:hypothetical protein
MPPSIFNKLLNVCLLTIVCGGIMCGSAAATGGCKKEANLAGCPLRVLDSNPRYFTDGTEQAIYLTGSHQWNNLLDWSDQPNVDYESHLDLLQSQNHNFIRMWTWEHASVPGRPWPDNPLPYQRTGPGNDLLGRPKFDVTKLNQAYFDRLRFRVKSAQDRKIYVSVMLFQGWSVERKDLAINPWPGHPFNIHNNVNDINGDLDGDGEGKEVHTLEVPAITALQEAYVRKVIDSLNDLDNVLYEISNESHADSQNWQYHMIDFIKRYESGQSKQHPVGMTVEYPGGDNSDLTNSLADWISPREVSVPVAESLNSNYKSAPPIADGKKVIITDTDHLWGLGGNPAWVWKSFLRGLNPIFMDLDSHQIEKHADRVKLPEWESIRRAMGHTLAYAKRMDLAAMVPHSKIASSGYCLTKEGEEYLVYLPPDHFESVWEKWASKILRFVFQKEFVKKTVSLDLSAASVSFAVEWFNPKAAETMIAETTRGGAVTDFTAPFPGDAVLYVHAQN